ncbi:recombinase family protein [Streptomyces sp. NPDC057460]|uniref:recombinase family protein n=1 Tax=Streptomyces sp. NPDC057460 TaxID=3346141 RepID=UPI003683FF4D
MRIFAHKKSGKNAEREELRKALDFLREGDTLVVPSLDRLGRSIQDLIAIVSGLRKRGIGFTSLHEALDTTTPGGRLVFHVFAALAEFIRFRTAQSERGGNGNLKKSALDSIDNPQFRLPHGRVAQTLLNAVIIFVANLRAIERFRRGQGIQPRRISTPRTAPQSGQPTDPPRSEPLPAGQAKPPPRE